ncbi:hypothetical protein WJX84_011703 [Apatococcus fuscideae]|uniref:Uncharacterized protein n=1 Tax=Apatococcus fuscideae TaxID=2026836 RepID=A0AAW1T019_9CHLO
MPGPSLPPRQARDKNAKSNKTTRTSTSRRDEGSSSSSSQDTSNTTQSSADVPHTWPDSTTGGMHQGGTPVQAMIQPGASPQQGASPSAAFQQQASMITQLPIMQKLMSDPGMLDRATQASPHLRALFSQSPQLAAMMQPGPLQGLVSAAQHPADFQQYVAGNPNMQHLAQMATRGTVFPWSASPFSLPGMPAQPPRMSGMANADGAAGRRGGAPLASREHSFRELPQPGARPAPQHAHHNPPHSGDFSFQQPPQKSSAYPHHPASSGMDALLRPPHSTAGGTVPPMPDLTHSSSTAAHGESLLVPGARWVSPAEQWATQQQLRQEQQAAGPDMGLGGVPGQMLAVAGQMEPALFGLAHTEAGPTDGSSAQLPGLPVSYPGSTAGVPTGVQAGYAQHSSMEGPEPFFRRYFQHADAVYPPVFIICLAAVCYWGLLPPLLLLVALLPAFLVGLQCFIVEGQGMRPARLVASRFTASLVASLQVTHLLTFMHGMWQLLLDHSLPGCLFIVLCALVPLLQWRLIKMDPGYLEQAPEGASPTSPASEASSKGPAWAQLPRNNLITCYTCHLRRPLRSKHCATCNR